MDARQQYEAEVIELFAGIARPSRPARSAISDQQYFDEIALAKRLRAAVAELIAASEAVNENSGFRRIDMQSIRDTMADEMPDFTAWQERLDNARQGYI